MTKIEGLQEYVKYEPLIESVWFDDRGNWCFSKTEVFTKEFSREDVLAKGFEAKLLGKHAEGVEQKDNTNTKK